MKLEEIENQLRAKSINEINETIDIMFSELDKLYTKYNGYKNGYKTLIIPGSRGSKEQEIFVESLGYLKARVAQLVIDDLSRLMVHRKTKELLDKIELL